LKKRILGTVLAIRIRAVMTLKRLVFLAILAMFLIVIIQPVACFYLDKTLENPPSIPKTYRLLAIEGSWSETQSGEYLIRELTQFGNWNNQTGKAYIRLLSSHSLEECIDPAKPYLVGNSTKDNMRSQILDFLGQAGPEDFSLLYFNNHGDDKLLQLDELINSTELSSWLEPIKGTLCIVLDACLSGSWINDGQGGVLGGPGRIVLCSSHSNQTSAGLIGPYHGGIFTGYEKTYYSSNNTYIPVGLIGAISANRNSNSEWLSVEQWFEYANSSLVGSFHTEDPTFYNGLGFDPPLIMLPPQQARFSVSLTAWVNETFTVKALDGMTNYTWDFGDGNIITSAQSTINYTYNHPGDYAITLNVTDNQGFSYEGTYGIIAKILGDINGDSKVNLPDLVFMTLAYGSKPSSSNWNSDADLDGNGIVGLHDLVLLAQHYGQQYP
jgi:hypothetical protein